MPGELTKEKVREILVRGRSISDADWIRHTRDRSLRTVYHMCDALRVSPGRLMSFRELHELFRKKLKDTDLPEPPSGFNPVDHVSSLWTIYEDPKISKLEGDFIPEITELLDRQPEDKRTKSKFNYRIRFRYHDTVNKIFDELNGLSADSTDSVEPLPSGDSVPHSQPEIASAVPPENDPASNSVQDSTGAPDGRLFSLSEPELEESGRRYWNAEGHVTDSSDARERIERGIVLRRGQQEFRTALIAAYDGKCAITSYDAVYALEAAHLIPFNGDDTNQVFNGLLLRADIHTLLDMNLIAVNPVSLEIEVSPKLTNTSYRFLKGSVLRQPREVSKRPYPEALEWRWKLFLDSTDPG